MTNNEAKKTDWYLISILLLAAFLRLYLLNIKPPHHDEGINGWFADQIAQRGFYHYDPTNYHGPLHFYIIYFFKLLFGRSLFALRLPSILMGLFSVYWITLFSRFFNRKLCLIAALGMAISPGCVFYSRYAIHESDFVFFNILLLWGILGLYLEGKSKYLWAVCLSICGVILTKETYIIHIACYACAFVAAFYLIKQSTKNEMLPVKQLWSMKDLTNILLVCGLLIIYFYSDAFSNFKSLYNLIGTFTPWIKTGTEHSGHEKPFFYWFNLFSRYEWIALFGLFCSISYIFHPDKWIRFISSYSVLVFLIYSFIPYKTPWCIVSLLWPFYFVAGQFISKHLESKWRNELVVVFILVSIGSLYKCSKLNFVDYVDKKEPYVYVQTFTDLNYITEPILKLAEKNPNFYNIRGHVIREPEWPLPWIFGDFKRIGYYKSKMKPEIYDADFLVVEKSRIQEVEEKLMGYYYTRLLQIRDSQDSTKVYFRYPLFKQVFPRQAPNFIPRNTNKNINTIYKRTPGQYSQMLQNRHYSNYSLNSMGIFQML